MGYRIGDVITVDFTTHNPYTGNVSNTDFPPTCQVFEDANDVPILLPAVVGRVGWVGIYRVSFVVSVANGFEAGRSYNVVVGATVVGVSARAVLLVFNVEAPVPTHYRI